MLRKTIKPTSEQRRNLSDEQRKEDQDNIKAIVGEIRTITGEPIVGGSYKFLRKAIQR